MTLGGKKIVKLPCGYVENGTSIDEVEVRAMTGVEEDLFSDRNLPMVNRLRGMVVNCIERIGDVKDKAKIEQMAGKFSAEDQAVLLVALRQISVGNSYALESECPSCGVPIKLDVDLTTITVKKASKEKSPLEVQLPSGRKAKVRIMTLDDAMKTSELRLQGEGRLTAAVWVRLAELDGKQPTLEDVKGLLFADRVFLRNVFDELEGGIEETLKVTCPQCKRQFMEPFDMATPEFFSPSAL